jgi:hypothetical protein
MDFRMDAFDPIDNGKIPYLTPTIGASILIRDFPYLIIQATLHQTFIMEFMRSITRSGDAISL